MRSFAEAVAEEMAQVRQDDGAAKDETPPVVHIAHLLPGQHSRRLIGREYYAYSYGSLPVHIVLFPSSSCLIRAHRPLPHAMPMSRYSLEVVDGE